MLDADPAPMLEGVLRGRDRLLRMLDCGFCNGADDLSRFSSG